MGGNQRGAWPHSSSSDGAVGVLLEGLLLGPLAAEHHVLHAGSVGGRPHLLLQRAGGPGGRRECQVRRPYHVHVAPDLRSHRQREGRRCVEPEQEVASVPVRLAVAAHLDGKFLGSQVLNVA